MRALWLIPLAFAALFAACKKPAPATTQELPHLPAVGEFLPPSLDVPDYVGAAACAECHRGDLRRLAESPHGRSMAVASPDTVLASFDGPPVTLSDGTVSFAREGDAFFMDIASRTSHERRKVDLVLASGRQHQLYVVKGADGAPHAAARRVEHEGQGVAAAVALPGGRPRSRRRPATSARRT